MNKCKNQRKKVLRDLLVDKIHNFLKTNKNQKFKVNIVKMKTNLNNNNNYLNKALLIKKKQKKKLNKKLNRRLPKMKFKMILKIK